MGEYSHVGTNTYYGRFPASYWQRWTTATEVRFEGRTRGAGRLMLRASDTNGVPRTLAVHDTATEDVRLAAPLDRFLDGGGLWIEIVTDDDELVLHDARWTVAAPPVDRGASVVVCTHNRADDCIATLQALTAEHDVLALLDEVVVVDQGTDRIDTREGFADVAARLGDHFRYLPQPQPRRLGRLHPRALRGGRARGPSGRRRAVHGRRHPLRARGGRAARRRSAAASPTPRSSAPRCSTCCTRPRCSPAPSTPCSPTSPTGTSARARWASRT